MTEKRAEPQLGDDDIAVSAAMVLGWCSNVGLLSGRSSESWTLADATKRVQITVSDRGPRDLGHYIARVAELMVLLWCSTRHPLAVPGMQIWTQSSFSATV